MEFVENVNLTLESYELIKREREKGMDMIVSLTNTIEKLNNKIKEMESENKELTITLNNVNNIYNNNN